MKFDKAGVAKLTLALFIVVATTPFAALAQEQPQQPAKKDKEKHTRQPCPTTTTFFRPTVWVPKT
jgi:hypothetical protein